LGRVKKALPFSDALIVKGCVDAFLAEKGLNAAGASESRCAILVLMLTAAIVAAPPVKVEKAPKAAKESAQPSKKKSKVKGERW
jgi:hypothetical protein